MRHLEFSWLVAGCCAIAQSVVFPFALSYDLLIGTWFASLCVHLSLSVTTLSYTTRN